MLRILRLIALFCFAAMSILLFAMQPCEATTVKQGHPRIWLNPTTKTELISKLSPNGNLHAYYLKIKSHVDSSSYGSGNCFAVHRYWLSVLLCALVEPDTYMQKVRDQVVQWTSGSYLHNDTSQAMVAITYDWLFDKLTSAEKQAIAQQFVDWWQKQDVDYIHDSWNNHTMEEVQGYIFGALAIYGDGYQDAAASNYLVKARDWLYNEILPATNLAAGALAHKGSYGGWAEGSYYFVRGSFALIESLYAWSSATDEDALQESISMRYLAKWIFYTTRNDGTLARTSDGYAITSSLTGAADASVTLYMLSSLYNDPYARYLWNQRVTPNGILSASTLSTGYSSMYTFYVLFNNSTSPIVLQDQPTSVYFDGMEMVSMRASFNAGDTFFLYKNNDKMTGHDHLDAGHFEIATSGGLAIDAGAYEGGDTSPNRHDTKFYQRTIAHNTVLVDDPNEVWVDNYGRYTTNDGGQKWCGPRGGPGRPQRYSDFMSDSSYDRGEIVTFEDTPYFTYLMGNPGPAYSRGDGSDVSRTNSRKMDSFTREVVYLDHKYFVVLDKVKTTEASRTKHWLLHTINEPNIEGNLFSAMNGTSTLFMRMLLPQQKTITKRGSTPTPQQYWTTCSSVGENPTFNTSYYGKSPNEPGAWRIEITPDNPQELDYFLNVLFTGTSSTYKPTSEVIETGDMLGVVIKDQSEDYIVFFKRSVVSTPVTSSITYNLTTTNNSRTVLVGVKQSTVYNVFIGGVGSSKVQSSANGVLTFENMSQGTFTYHLFGPDDNSPPPPHFLE